MYQQYYNNIIANMVEEKLTTWIFSKTKPGEFHKLGGNWELQRKPGPSWLNLYDWPSFKQHLQIYLST